MRREDVEALLAACERDRIGPHPSNETLAALCRRWLTVEDAPAADIRDDGKNGGESALLSAATRAGYYQGQRVRIVPEQGEG